MEKYALYPYQENFPVLFEKEKKRILSHLKPSFQIEHVGSTAVPGLPGKGIIDLAMLAPDQSLHDLEHSLVDLGYLYRAHASRNDHAFWRTDLPDPDWSIRRYHLHVYFSKNQEWKQLLRFRNRLRTDSQAKKAYIACKKKAVEQSKGNGEVYRSCKQDLIEQLLLPPKE